jgi:hypothetical protein
VALKNALTALGEDVRFVDVPGVDHFGIVAGIGAGTAAGVGGIAPDLVSAGIKQLLPR